MWEWSPALNGVNLKSGRYLCSLALLAVFLIWPSALLVSYWESLVKVHLFREFVHPKMKILSFKVSCYDAYCCFLFVYVWKDTITSPSKPNASTTASAANFMDNSSSSPTREKHKDKEKQIRDLGFSGAHIYFNICMHM